MMVRTVVIALVLAIAMSSPAFAAYEIRSYGGISVSTITKTLAGYYLGCVSLENNSPNYQSLHYEQQTVQHRSHTLSGTLEYGAEVDVDAFARVNYKFSESYAYTSTITQGTRVGSTCQVSPWHIGTLKAYFYRANISGQERVKVETYPDPGGDEPPKAESIGGGSSIEGGLVTIESEPVVTYEYHSFTGRYPSETQTHLVYSETAIP